jgi:hypothetical protein
MEPHGLSPMDLAELKQTLGQGQIYIKDDFLSPDLVDFLRKDISVLVSQGAFAPSGLSNRAKGEQQEFGQKDRSVCPVRIALEDPNMKANSEVIGTKLDSLCDTLSVLLDRPTLKDRTLGHESYFSRSLPGASLSRHVDERHEEIKGTYGVHKGDHNDFDHQFSVSAISDINVNCITRI